VAFAKNPWHGLNTYRVGWPQYLPFEPTSIRPDYDNITGANVALRGIYNATCLTTYPIAHTDTC
jgi:hypothetical protein